MEIDVTNTSAGAIVISKTKMAVTLYNGLAGILFTIANYVKEFLKVIINDKPIILIDIEIGSVQLGFKGTPVYSIFKFISFF